MAVDLDTSPYIGDDAIAIDDKRAAIKTEDSFSIEELVLEHPVLFAHRLVAVAQYSEGEFVVCFELLVGFYAVAADTEHHSAPGGKIVDLITEIDGLARSARSVVFGVEIEDHFFFPKILEGHGITRIRFQ